MAAPLRQSLKLPDRDPYEPLLPAAAFWEIELADMAHPYVLAALRSGSIILSEEAGIAPVIFEGNPVIEAWIADYTGLLARRVTETVRAGIRQALINGVREGLTGRELRDSILEAFGCVRNEAGKIIAADKLKYRAEVISRTEMSRANTAGYREAARAAGGARVVWRTLPGACEFCASLEGTAVGATDPFFRLGDSVTISVPGGEGEEDRERTMHLDYSDTDGPPLHPSCVCVLETEWE